MQLFQKTHFDFIGKRRVAYAISIILTGIGIASLVQKGGPRLGIDFTGGSLVQIAFSAPVELKDVRLALNEGGFTSVDLQSVADGNGVIIRVPKGPQAADTVAADL